MKIMVILAGMGAILLLLSIQLYKKDKQNKQIERAWKTAQEERKKTEEFYQKEKLRWQEKEQSLRKQMAEGQDRQKELFQTAANLFLYSQIAEEKNRASALKPALRTMTTQSRKMLFALQEEEKEEEEE